MMWWNCEVVRVRDCDSVSVKTAPDGCASSAIAVTVSAPLI